MVLWAIVLTRIDVSQASVSIYLLPFFGVLLSALTLHERITLTMVVGGLVTLAGTMFDDGLRRVLELVSCPTLSFTMSARREPPHPARSG